MNPSVNASPEFHLPEPIPAGSAGGPEEFRTPDTKPETLTAARPEAAAPANPMFPAPMQPIQSAPVAAPVTPQHAQGPAVAAPAAANDDDVIEKEWIDKAKQIVQTTRTDPFQQNQQLAAFKADYMQKRYGKTVKLSE